MSVYPSSVYYPWHYIFETAAPKKIKLTAICLGNYPWGEYFNALYPDRYKPISPKTCSKRQIGERNINREAAGWDVWSELWHHLMASDY